MFWVKFFFFLSAILLFLCICFQEKDRLQGGALEKPHFRIPAGLLCLEVRPEKGCWGGCQWRLEVCRGSFLVCVRLEQRCPRTGLDLLISKTAPNLFSEKDTVHLEYTTEKQKWKGGWATGGRTNGRRNQGGLWSSGSGNPVQGRDSRALCWNVPSLKYLRTSEN